MSTQRVPLAFVARGIVEDDEQLRAPWQPGDEYDGYAPIDEDAHYFPRPSTRRWETHPHDLPLPEDWQTWRIMKRHNCECRRPGHIVATERAGSDGNTWVFIKPERVPKSVRDSDRDDLAMPLHNDQTTGTPHVEATSCKCGRHYLVLVFDDLVQLVPARPRHAGKLQS